MIAELNFWLARVTIEMVTAFAVGAPPDDPYDSLDFLRDANDLPTIPGSSIAGVLRHLLAEGESADTMAAQPSELLFGYQRGTEGQRSRVEVSWAQVHDAADRPVPLRLDAPRGDEVLDFLSNGALRDHVRINALGAVDGAGKYQEQIVPAGARFTFELRLAAASDDQELADAWAQLLDLLASSAFRLGRTTRRGHGQVKLVRALVRRFDLRREQDRALLARLPVELAEPVPPGLLEPHEVTGDPDRDLWPSVRLGLRAEDFWIIGAGSVCREDQVDRSDPRQPREARMLPVFERRICWRKQGAQWRGEVTDEGSEALVPASSVKGVLRHRTAYHYRRLRREWAGAQAVSAAVNRGSRDAARSPDPEPVSDLFGDVLDDEAAGGRSGRRGRVIVSDVYVPVAARGEVGWLNHVSLDRYTQGPMDSMLFSEAPLYRHTVALQVVIQEPASGRVDDTVRRALLLALRDLCSGRLALGGGANRGHGYFELADGPHWNRCATEHGWAEAWQQAKSSSGGAVEGG